MKRQCIYVLVEIYRNELKTSFHKVTIFFEQNNINIMEEYIKEKSKLLESVVLKHNIFSNFILAAFDIVENFIKERGLILYGGQSLDFALRLKGSQIYDDSSIPDYDFFSPAHTQDAYDLGKILYDKGFPEINVIRAIHVQTMKVRIHNITIADISYIPLKWFQRFPTLKFRGLKCLHPNFQKIDMHLSLSTPFNNYPRVDLFCRNEKTIKRFNLISEYYKVEADKLTGPEQEIRCNVMYLDYILHGFACYALLYKRAATFADLSKFEEIIPAEINIRNDQIVLKLQFDKPPQFVFLGNPRFAVKKENCPIMNIRPRQKKDEVTFYQLDHTRLMIANETFEGHKIKITCVQYLLYYFLAQYYITDVAGYLAYYNSLLKILELAENSNENIMDSPFFGSKEEYGKKNITEAMTITLNNMREQLGENIVPINVPRRRLNYTKKLEELPIFDYNSIYFCTDGTSLQR